MLNLIPKLKADNIFFTNFYQGIRLDDGRYTGTTMIKRMYDCKPNKVKEEYEKLCNEFFKTQLDLVKPKLVVCLGHHVKNALISIGGVFEQWKPKSGSLKELYSDGKDKYITALNGIKFIIIPHPCYLPNLLKHPYYLEKLKDFLDTNEQSS
ncbi:MAG: uracil-DNA glycosylase family protein, partial [Sphingobacteriales bacterium]